MTSTNVKRTLVLGMNYSTACARLRRDVMFHLIQKLGYVCHRCDLPMTKNTFSIEHKVDWLNHENGKELFSDIDNIAFSHKACNLEASLVKKRKTAEEIRERRNKWQREYRKRVGRKHNPEERRRHYLKTGN